MEEVQNQIELCHLLKDGYATFRKPVWLFAKTTDDDEITKINITPPQTKPSVRSCIVSSGTGVLSEEGLHAALTAINSYNCALVVKDMDMQKIADNVGTSKTKLKILTIC